jgi:RecA-family ATPase
MSTAADRIRAALDEAPAYQPPQDEVKAPAILRTFRPIDLDGQPIPPRRYVIDLWLPLQCTTSLYGVPGVGKSYLAQAIGTAAAVGRHFLGQVPQAARVLHISTEDDLQELQRRQQAINAHFALSFRDLKNILWVPRGEMTEFLGTQERDGTLAMREPFTRLRQTVHEHKAQLIILDNIARLYGGDENNRVQVVGFLTALETLAMEMDAAVLLLGHPSKSSDFSGSTSWEGAVRSRWDLKRVADADEGEKITLARSKSNYAPLIDIKLKRLDNGVLVPDDPEVGVSGLSHAIDRRMREGNAQKAVLAALDALKSQKRATSHSPSARNFLPRVMLAAGLGEGFNKIEITRAMEALFARKAMLADQQLWRGGDRHWVAGIAAASWFSESAQEGVEAHDGEPVQAAEAPLAQVIDLNEHHQGHRQ